MKTTKVHSVIRRALCLVCVPLLAGGLMLAQQPAPPAQGSAQLLSPDQLDDLVAPVALYPDALLSQVLVAATYPLEVVEARQWIEQNSNLQGAQLVDAARQQNWDASVQALVALPDVMTTMNQDVQWTTALGNAFLAQQPDVMAAVQRMRARAEANGKLSSNSAQTVTTETGDGQTAIDIAPADPRVIYVPQYNPVYIWGPPVWGYYPPLYYGAYGFGYYPGINLAICFGGWGGWGGWGWGPNWFGGSVFVNAGFFNHYGYRGGLYAGGFAGRPLWQHDPAHRLGISYPNSRLTARYGSASVASRGAMTSMTRSTAMGYSRSNGTGNWNRFGSAPASAYGNRPMIPAARGTAPQNAGRPAEGQWQHFQGAQPNRAPAQQYSAPAQRNPGPAQQYQSAPRTQAPNYGGAGRSFGGGAAGNSGRSHSSGGGASHGGARR